MMKQIFIEAKTSVWKMVGLIALGLLTLVSIIGFIQLIANIVSQYIK